MNMNIQTIDISTISAEKTLRQDYDYHKCKTKLNGLIYSFSELFEIVPKSKIALSQLNQQFRYCEISDIDKNGDVFPQILNFEERNLLQENYYKKIEKGDIISVQEDDILISKIRPNLKKYVRITKENKDIYFTSAFIHLRAKMMPEILYYCFRSSFYDSLIAISRQGKGYPTLNENDLKLLKFDKIMIDLLFKNQKLIKSKIDSIEERVRELKKQLLNESIIIDNVFSQRFVFDYTKFSKLKKIKQFDCKQSDFSNNPDLRFSAKFHRNAGAFVMEQLNAITDKKIKHFISEPITLGASISPRDFDENGNAYYISMATIKTLEIELDDSQLISESYYKDNINKSVKPGDIIIARSGVAIGKTAFVKDDFDGIFADFTMRVRIDKNKCNPEFAYYYFRSSYFQYLIEIYKKGLQNQNIFPIVIQEFPMIDIPIEEQQCIVNEIKLQIKKQDKIKSEISELRAKIDEIIEETIIRGE